MADQDFNSSVDRFIIEQIDSVPHLEALLLLWNSRPREWTIEEMGGALYVSAELAEQVLADLRRRDLIQNAPNPADHYYYEADPGRDPLLQKLDRAYRHELVRITRLIHSKASVAVHDFARAFRFKKD